LKHRLKNIYLILVFRLHHMIMSSDICYAHDPRSNMKPTVEI